MKKSIGLLVVLTGLVFTANAQSSGGVTKQVVPFVAAGTTCGGEFIVLEGSWMIITNVVNDASGGFHVTDNWKIDASAVGSLGNSYILNYTDTFGFNITSGGAETFTNSVMFNIIGLGRTANDKLKTIVHTTYNSDGLLTADVDQSRFQCN